MRLLPLADIEMLEDLRTSDARKTELRARAFFNANACSHAAKRRPFLLEEMEARAAAGSPRTLPMHVFEPALASVVASVFPPPLAGGPTLCVLPLDWSEDEPRWTVPMAGAANVYRLGLTGSEIEMLETGALGCAGLFAPIAGRDLPALQFVVELARDCHLTYVPLPSSDAELDVVLGTDVSYVGFTGNYSARNDASGAPEGSPDALLSAFRQVRKRLPSGLHAVVVFGAEAGVAHALMAIEMGALAAVISCTKDLR